jgi:hypothetical protein
MAMSSGSLGTEMVIVDRIYRRTWAGQRAWDAQVRKVSPECWKVLGSIGAGTHAALVRASLQNCSEEDVQEWLAQLERIGLVESVPVVDENDLDFTGNFHLARIRAELEKLREKSEHIAQLLAR